MTKDKETYAFEIPEESRRVIAKVDKNVACHVFPDRIEGSTQCMNCTYNHMPNPTRNKRMYCVFQHYGYRHAANTMRLHNAVALGNCKDMADIGKTK